MRINFILLFIILGLKSYSQTSTTGFETPNYAAKSPEAAAFLKYGEYPVDLSTGVPNISIPLYDIEAKGLSIPISLNYHAGGIKVKQEASWVGLGWNLNFGAQIILSVKDGVDEGNDFINNIPSASTLAYYDSNPYAFNSGPITSEQFDKSRVRDIFYLSSPTANGQFYIDGSEIVVYPPDAFKVTGNRNQFKVIDASGNTYTFGTNGIETSEQQFTHGVDYKSAWYVTEILTNANDTISFEYESDGDLIEYSFTQSIEVKNTLFSCPCNRTPHATILPIRTAGGNITTTSKKIKEIVFDNGQSKVVFDREDGRQDLINQNSYLHIVRLVRKIANTSQYEDVKGYQFNYSYFNDSQTGTTAYKYKRLKLDYLQLLSEDGPGHEFVYSDVALPVKDSYAQDWYGYYNGYNNNTNMIPRTAITEPYAVIVGGAVKQVSSTYNQAGILKEIHYPTKGSTNFNYETNQYWGSQTNSYVANVEFGARGTGTGNGNPPPPSEDGCTTAPNCLVANYFPFTTSSNVNATLNVTFSNDVNDNETQIRTQFVRFRIVMNNANVPGLLYGNRNRNQTYTQTLQIPAGTGYIIAEAWGGHMSMAGTLTYNYSSTVSANRDAGGLRIGAIENRESDNVVVVKKTYDYTTPNSSRSSGTFINDLATNFTTPTVSNYDAGYCGTGDISTTPSVNVTTSYNFTSNSQFGIEGNTMIYSDVIEKIVDPVNAGNNGYTHYKFSTSPDLILDPAIQVSTPWLRGKLLEKTIFSSNNTIFVRKEINNYMEDLSRISYINGFKMKRRATTTIEGPGLTPPTNMVNDCGMVQNVQSAVQFIKYRMLIPWYYLKSTQVTENFFNSGNTLVGTVITNKTYNYNNPTHLQLSSEVSTNSLGETIENKYYYPGDTEVSTEPNVANLITKNILKPLKVQTFNGSTKISEKKTVYKNWENTILLPELVQGGKGSEVPTTRLRFVKVDAANGNVLQVKQENGTDITYIWGYNGTYPIAKIENATFDAAVAALGTTAASLKALTSAPTNIRTALPNAMVTTYSYSPLEGISSVTDPKGYTMYYDYDGEGRLLSIKEKDSQGNDIILSENQYHYKP